MQENENQYGQDVAGRRKVILIITGILMLLAAVCIVIFLLRDKTKASTGTGGTAVIAPDRIGQISDEVSEQVLDTLLAGILTDMVKNSVKEELTEDKIYKIVSNGDVEVIQIGDAQLRALIAKMLEDLGISGDGILSDAQQEAIRLAVDQMLQESLSNISVTQLLTEEEKKQLEDRLKRELSKLLQEQVKNSTYKLTDEDLSKIKNSLHLENLVKSTVNQITRQQLTKLETNIINRMKKSVKTPVKGVDYLTDAEIKSIQETIQKKVGREVLKQIESLASKMNDVKEAVSVLKKQVAQLQKQDKEQSSDIIKLQKSVTEINASIKYINSVTKELTGAINISGSSLEKVSGTGSEILSAKVSVSNMTIAEFVDILAGNDKVYTGAIQELNKIVGQLQEENGRQDEAFGKSLTELKDSLGENGKELEDVREKLAQSGETFQKQLEKTSEDLKKQLEQQSGLFREQLESERQARQEADENLQKKTDETNALIGDKAQAGKIEGNTIFEKIGAIVKILSLEGIEGLRNALKGIGGAETVEDGIRNIQTGMEASDARINELEKEKWYSDITLLAQGQEGNSGYHCQESGSAYVYQIPLITEDDNIRLEEDDTAIVVTFREPGRLPSNVAFSTSGSDLFITFTNKPTRNIEIVSIHVYKEK